MGQEKIGTNAANKKCVSEDLTIQTLPSVMVTSSCNPWRIGFPIYSTFQLQIKYSILSRTFEIDHSLVKRS